MLLHIERGEGLLPADWYGGADPYLIVVVRPPGGAPPMTYK